MTDGSTALIYAPHSSHLEVVRLLLEAGADKDAAITNYGATALHVAAAEGHLEVVRLLLEAGADRVAATTGAETASSIAAQHGHWAVVHALAASRPS